MNGIGLILTIAHALGYDVIGNLLRRTIGRSTTPASARGWDHNEKAGTYTDANRKSSRAPTGSMAKGASATQVVRQPNGGSRMKKVFGWILAIFGLIAVLSTARTGLWNLLTSIAILLGGVALITSGYLGDRKTALYHRIVMVCGGRGIIKIAELAKTMGRSVKQTIHLINDMLDRGYFGPRAYVDHVRGLLVIRPEDMREVYRAEDEAQAAKEQEQKAAEEAARSEYDRYVELIRQANEDIRDEVMSAKIERMQIATASIFREIEEHPEKKSQINRFMNYYLPTTLKLLKSYARIEQQGVTGENMAKAKADIERIAETLAAGYEKQLDNLYQAEAMDIAGDVNVIENMMRRHGLTGQDDFGQTMGGH